MKKSHCLFSNLKNKFLLALAVIAMAFVFTGCPNPTVPGEVAVVPVQINSIDDIKGVWEDNSYGSIYEITTSTIDDVLTPCSYDIKSSTFVTSQDGYTLIFCQCSQGTPYTPTGNYYVIAVKKYSNDTLDIVCPCDFDESYTGLSELQEVYVSTYGVEANGNWKSNCTRIGNKVTVFDSSNIMSKCGFTSNRVSFSMMGSSGWSEYNSFTPTRDTSKETGTTVLYLYNASERQIYGADLNYCAVKNVNGTKYVYWYIYDDEEDENDYMVESIYPDYMPVVSDDNLTALQQMYQ